MENEKSGCYFDREGNFRGWTEPDEEELTEMLVRYSDRSKSNGAEVIKSLEKSADKRRLRSVVDKECRQLEDMTFHKGVRINVLYLLLVVAGAVTMEYLESPVSTYITLAGGVIFSLLLLRVFLRTLFDSMSEAVEKISFKERVFVHGLKAEISRSQDHLMMGFVITFLFLVVLFVGAWQEIGFMVMENFILALFLSYAAAAIVTMRIGLWEFKRFKKRLKSFGN